MDPLSAPDWDLQDIDKDVEVDRFFLAAQSSSRSLVVSRSVYPSVGRKSFVKKLPLLEYKKNIWHFIIIVATVATVATVMTVVAAVTVLTIVTVMTVLKKQLGREQVCDKKKKKKNKKIFL